VAAATNAVVDAHDHIVAFIFEQPVVAETNAFLHGGRQFFTPGLQLGQVFLEIHLALVDQGDLVIHEFFGGRGRLGGIDDFALGHLGLFHQADFHILDFEDGLFGHFDLVGQSFVFLVLAGLELLVGVLFDLRFFGFDVQFEAFPLGFDLFDAEFGRVKLGLGGGGFGD